MLFTNDVFTDNLRFWNQITHFSRFFFLYLKMKRKKIAQISYCLLRYDFVHFRPFLFIKIVKVQLPILWSANSFFFYWIPYRIHLHFSFLFYCIFNILTFFFLLLLWFCVFPRNDMIHQFFLIVYRLHFSYFDFGFLVYAHYFQSKWNFY